MTDEEFMREVFRIEQQDLSNDEIASQAREWEQEIRERERSRPTWDGPMKKYLVNWNYCTEGGTEGVTEIFDARCLDEIEFMLQRLTSMFADCCAVLISATEIVPIAVDWQHEGF
jgi:hypothetical protein